MAETRFDLVGIGNALVDVLVNVEDGFLEAEDLPKGAMMLVDSDRSDALYARLSDLFAAGIEMSGGSCGNTMAGFAGLGGRGAYIGKVKGDRFGEAFRRGMADQGVSFETAPAADGPATGKCLVMVSPDAQRTMATFLGAATQLTPDDVDPDVIAAGKVVYLEGYLFDEGDAKNAFIKAADLAHNAGRDVSLTLSDGFCVDRHRDAFRTLVEDHVDILFANEQEILSLYQVDQFDAALQQVRGHCKVACLTRSDKGSVILSGDEVHVVDAMPVDRVVDTTGAGDLYAAGFLYGYTQGMDLYRCGQIGSLAAAEIVSHYGARPEADLKTLAAARLGA